MCLCIHKLFLWNIMNIFKVTFFYAKSWNASKTYIFCFTFLTNWNKGFWQRCLKSSLLFLFQPNLFEFSHFHTFMKTQKHYIVNYSSNRKSTFCEMVYTFGGWCIHLQRTSRQEIASLSGFLSAVVHLEKEEELRHTYLYVVSNSR